VPAGGGAQAASGGGQTRAHRRRELGSWGRRCEKKIKKNILGIFLFTVLAYRLICASEASAYKHVYGHVYSCFYNFVFMGSARDALKPHGKENLISMF
jgi:hypothetical protein